MATAKAHIGPRRVERRHHKVDRLPAAVRDELARRFQAGETYEALVAYLASKGHAVGRSSVHRWGSQFQRRLERLRALREQAQGLVAEVQGKPATELNEVAEQTAVQMMFEYLLELAELPAAGAEGAAGGAEAEARPDVEARSGILARVGRALSDLGRSASGREALKLAFRREFEQAKTEAADTAKAALEQAGASTESVAAVVDRILGIGA